MTKRAATLVTTPIYYVNDVPHVGHAYTTIAADALCRARRLRGEDVFFLTGTDEHGQNIERIAREHGVGEQEYCDRIAARFRDLWARYDLLYDDFIRTTDERHLRGVLELWSRLSKATTPDGRPAVYRGKYSGWYCPRCEGFKVEAELRQPGNVCADHERPCEWTEEENYFFRLSAYEGWLSAEIESGRLRIDPEGRRNECLAVLRQGLQDFSVSRARVKWGIPVPEEPSHVFYVWIDALANYITALGFADHGERYVRYWEESTERLHLVGKEIIRFHCLYWPAMLHAASLPVPNRIFAHGHLTKDGKKLSKTTGNVIDPEALVARHGPDAVRFFLLREGSFGQDWDFTDEAFVRRFNSDLANDLGNLVSRALTMVGRYCQGRVPARPTPGQGPGLEEQIQRDGALDGEGASLRRGVLDRYEAVDYVGALSELWAWVAQLNQRIVAVSPWELAKDPARKPELDAFLYRLLEAIRLVSLLVSPVMPRAGVRIQTMLGLAPAESGPEALGWGRLEPGRPLGSVEPLFPRLETAADAAAPAPAERKSKEKRVSETKPATPPVPAVPAPAAEAAPVSTSSAPPAASAVPAGDRIDIAEFARIDLRVAEIKAAERIPGSKKLIRLQVDIGTEVRQVVAGIAEAYAPEALVGRKLALVANLKPAKLMGVESNGMILAASLDGKPVLTAFDADVPAGTKIK